LHDTRRADTERKVLLLRVSHERSNSPRNEGVVLSLMCGPHAGFHAIEHRSGKMVLLLDESQAGFHHGAGAAAFAAALQLKVVCSHHPLAQRPSVPS
jgi:hypothetical protein